MFKTITAKFAGKCRRCQGPIQVGSKIRFGGRGLVYHLAKDCPKSQGAAVNQPSDDDFSCGDPSDVGEPLPLTFSHLTTGANLSPPDRSDLDYEDRCREQCSL